MLRGALTGRRLPGSTPAAEASNVAKPRSAPATKPNVNVAFAPTARESRATGAVGPATATPLAAIAGRTLSIVTLPLFSTVTAIEKAPPRLTFEDTAERAEMLSAVPEPGITVRIGPSTADASTSIRTRSGFGVWPCG